MAKRSFKWATWTPTATADTVSFGANTYQALLGTASTQRTNILEVYLGGQAASSAPCIMVLSRDSTVASTPTALTTGQSDEALDAATAALASPVSTFSTASAQPQRSASRGLLNLSFNAFGGIVRWVAAPGEEISMVGNSASLGEISLSAYTGGTVGLLGSHIIFETL